MQIKAHNPTPPNPNCITTREAAEYLTKRGYRIAPKSLEVYRCLGKGPKYKSIGGRRIFYEQKWLDEFLAGIEVKVFDPATGQVR